MVHLTMKLQRATAMVKSEKWVQNSIGLDQGHSNTHFDTYGL